MARKKKAAAVKSLLFAVVVAIGGVIWFVSEVPAEVWYLVAFAAVAYFGHRIYRSVKGVAVVGLPVPVHPSSSAAPVSPWPSDNATWVPEGHPIAIDGLTIPGGMVYVGTTLNAPNGGIDPALINPKLPIAKTGDFQFRLVDHWPSYSTVTPVARRAYLQWLASGRCDPLADNGYVYLFFYGLERRAIVDAHRNAVAKADWPAIGNELRRLLVIYGDDRSFKSHAYGLLKWVDRSIYAQQCGDKLYEQPAPPMTREPELPFHLRLALGQASRDQAPLPAEFVLEWVRLAPQIAVSKPMKRVPKMFARLFMQKYVERFGAGMVLPHSNAVLKLTYRAASPGMLGEDIHLGFGGAPDSGGLIEPLAELQAIVDEVSNELESYLRSREESLRSSSEQEAVQKLTRDSSSYETHAPHSASPTVPAVLPETPFESPVLVGKLPVVAVTPEPAPDPAQAAPPQPVPELDASSINTTAPALGFDISAPVGVFDIPVSELDAALNLPYDLRPDETLVPHRAPPTPAKVLLEIPVETPVLVRKPLVVAAAPEPAPDAAQAAPPQAVPELGASSINTTAPAPGHDEAAPTGVSAIGLPVSVQPRASAAPMPDQSVYAQKNGDKRPVLPFHLRLALGQAARDQTPLPAEFALEWVKLAPQIVVRKPMQRAPKVFARLFVEKYIERFGAGMVLPHSNAILKLTYRAASPGMLGEDISLGFGGAPDSGGLIEPLVELQAIADDVSNELETYLRDREESLDSLSELETAHKRSRESSYETHASHRSPPTAHKVLTATPFESPVGVRKPPVVAIAPAPPQAAAPQPVAAPARKVVLDMGKVAALQKDTAQVTARLGEIFADKTSEPVPAPVTAQLKPGLQPVKPTLAVEGPPPAPSSTVVLDMTRVTALQMETARVTALLADIFVEEPPPPTLDQTTPAVEAPVEGVLGLDPSHSAFTRMLLSRPAWTRAELFTVALDCNVMLDGALERTNEAAFDAFDETLTEGADPVVVNQEVLEKLLS
jgi:hypothetical protein